MEAMYDVYDFDPLIIINMFHLQSSETLKNLSESLLAEIKELSQKSIGAIAKIFEEGIEKGHLCRTPSRRPGRHLLVHVLRRRLWEASKKIISADKGLSEIDPGHGL
jgi:hypothetical protein